MGTQRSIEMSYCPIFLIRFFRTLIIYKNVDYFKFSFHYFDFALKDNKNLVRRLDFSFQDSLMDINSYKPITPTQPVGIWAIFIVM
jgi:hypothetical protein